MWARTRVGLFSFSITLATVKVFPEPVTPRRVCPRFPDFMEFVSSSKKREALITSLEKADFALMGETGTRIVAN